jgi:hypothetical protein
VTTATERRSPPDIDVAGVARTRHPLRWVVSIILLILAAQLVNLLIIAPLPCCEDQMCVEVVDDMTSSADIGMWFPSG